MKKHNIVITGGGGFIGTQMSHELAELGHEITIVDRDPPRHYYPGVYRQEDYQEFFATNEFQFDTVIHLAAEHLVAQSVFEPEKYYTNNVVKMKSMLDDMTRVGIKNIIFSSSGNIYGRQGWAGQPLKEDENYYDPQNPYASTKVAGEMLLKDYARAYGLRYVAFRYFNAAGADPDGRFGYVQDPATHVIPILCKKIKAGDIFMIYGTDYPTKDGSCVRDYVHVSDLAKAHAKGLEFLDAGFENEVFNIGGGSDGVSVHDLTKYFVGITDEVLYSAFAEKREGDPAVLVADISKAKKMLGWEPKYNIGHIIQHAWQWENK